MGAPTCKIADDDGDWSGPIMLIMRGNSGEYEDENGNKRQWPNGALHEGPDVKGNSKPPGRDAKPGQGRQGSRNT